MKIKASQEIKVVFTTTEEVADKFLDFLNEQYDVEFEITDEKDGEYTIKGGETADGWYDPPVYYTKNGDGYPGEREIEFEVWEEELFETCQEFAKQYEEEEFCLESCTCKEVEYE